MAEVIVFFIYYALAALVLGSFARRKNRSLAWAFIGPLFCFPSLIALAFMSFLCPRCRGPLTNEEWQQKRCPRCDAGAGTPTGDPQRAPGAITASGPDGSTPSPR